MKKILIAIIFVMTFLSCKKGSNGKFCYRCTFGISPAGYQKPVLDTCCDDNPRGDFQWRDPYGNDIVSFCQPK